MVFYPKTLLGDRFPCAKKVLTTTILQAEAAALAGENSFKLFVVAVQHCSSSIAILQQVKS